MSFVVFSGEHWNADNQACRYWWTFRFQPPMISDSPWNGHQRTVRVWSTWLQVSQWLTKSEIHSDLRLLCWIVVSKCFGIKLKQRTFVYPLTLKWTASTGSCSVYTLWSRAILCQKKIVCLTYSWNLKQLMYLGCLRNLGNVSNQVTNPVYTYVCLHICIYIYLHCMWVVSQLLTMYYIFITCGHPNRIWWPISWPRLCWPCLSASIRCLDASMEIDAVGAGRISSWVGYVRTTKNGHTWARQASNMIVKMITHKKENSMFMHFPQKGRHVVFLSTSVWNWRRSSMCVR